MTENPLIVDVAAEGRATVILNRPDVHNAFDDKLIAHLTRELDALDRNPTVGVVVLAAAGKSFCAGADLKWMRRMAEYSEAENQADAEALADALEDPLRTDLVERGRRRLAAHSWERTAEGLADLYRRAADRG